MRRFCLALLGALVVLGGCKVQGRVDISVYDDGSGSVTVAVGLDAEALTELGDPSTALQTADLLATGWKVSPPRREGDRTWIRATKRFRSARDLGPTLDEIGLFRNWRLSIADGFGSTTWKVNGVINARTGLDQFSDDKLAAALDGLALGLTPDELRAKLQRSGPINVDVSVHLPGDTGDRTRFALDVAGKSPQQRVAVTSERSSSAPTRWFVLGGVLLAGAAVLGVIGHLSVTRRRYRRRS